MREYLQFYIDGRWVDPVTPKTVDVINPANEQGRRSRLRRHGGLVTWTRPWPPPAAPSKPIRAPAARIGIDLLQRVLHDEYKRRFGEFAQAITEEMGAPAKPFAARSRPAPGCCT